ncbi:MAG: flagellar hook-associated protein FlgK [Gammaproteobacteria bacterium]|nr:flagellar hook-associated protein FlgK [Gammaproteobacteria bacterium]
MSDLLSIGLSGVLANQSALATAGHNIANVSTAGYSRQSVELQAAVSGKNTGSGVFGGDAQRVYEGFWSSQLQQSGSESSRLQTFNDMARTIDDILADPQGGMTPALQNFFSALQDVASDPGASSTRIALLSESEALSSRFQSLDRQFNDQGQYLNGRVSELVNEINGLAEGIQGLNGKLMGSAEGASPDLLDQRDHLLTLLADKVAVKTSNNGDGTVNVFIGNGQTLVSGVESFKLTTKPSAEDARELVVVYEGVGGSSDISSQIRGGEMGGLMDFRNEVLSVAKNHLGRVAVGIEQSVNQLHRQGMDLQGNLGGDFFSTAQPSALANRNNQGNANVAVQISDVSQLTTQNYQLSYDGAAWSLASDNGASQVSGVGPDLVLNGVTVSIVNNAAVAGDRFQINPLEQAASSLTTVLKNGNEIAAASPLKTSAEINNGGTARLSGLSINDVGNAALLAPVTLVFDAPPTRYSLLDGTTGAVLVAAQAYSGNDNVNLNGWQVNLQGQANAGDRFNIGSNVGGTADNRAMLSISALQSQGVLNQGASSFQEAYSELVVNVGSVTRKSAMNRDAQQALFDQVTARRESVAGVNLDEEAANLVRYQKAYQAAAQVISTSQSLFQTLLNAVR